MRDGPTGLMPFGRDLDWRTFAGYRYFVEGDLFGTRNIALLGCGLELDIDGVLPGVSAIMAKGGVFVGDDLTGYTVGLGLSF